MAEQGMSLREKIDSLKNRLSNLKEKTQSSAAKIQRLATAAAGAYAYGSMEAGARRRGEQMSTIGDMDPMLTWGIGAALASDYIGGRMGEVMADAGTGIVAAYAYKQATT